MTPLSFQKWREQELATRSPDMMVDCEECSGGEVTCEECGHPHDCETCNGTGLRRFGDLKPHEQIKVLDVFEYEKQLIADYAAVARYTVTQPEAFLLDAELQPYVLVRFLSGGMPKVMRGNMGVGALERLRC